jgi:hypothetical protein
MIRIGKEIGGSAAMVLGAFIMLWDDFATPWENVPVTGHLRGLLAYLTGAVLMAAGAGVFWPRTARAAAAVLAAISLGFTLLWAQVVARAPQIYDPWGNVAEESAMAAGYLAIFASLAPQKTINMARFALGARVWFGVCSISFGVVHFENLEGCARFVPNWMPLGGLFWSVFTGVAHLATAVAVLSGIWALLAARLAALMYLGFGLLGWGTVLVGRPTDHFAWGGEIITFVLVAAAWMIGDSFAVFPSRDGQLFLPRAALVTRRPRGISEAVPESQ